MAALIGYKNYALTGTLTTGSETAALGVGNLTQVNGSAATGWQTRDGVMTSTAGAWITLDMGSNVPWRAMGLFKTNLSPGATLRYRLSTSASSASDEVPSLDLDLTPSFSAPTGWSFSRADTVGGSSKACGTRWNSTGVLEVVALNTPRFDYDPTTGVYRGLLVEVGRTNSIRNPKAIGGVAGTPGTVPTNWAVGLPSGLSQTITAVTTESGMPSISIRISGTPTATDQVIIRFETSTGIAATVGQIWSQSVFTRLVGGSLAGVTNMCLVQVERNSSGANNDAVGTGTAFSLTNAPLSTQRRTYVRTLTTATCAYVQPTIQFTATNGSAVDLTIQLAIPQIEVGSVGYVGVSSPIMPIDSTIGASFRGGDVSKMTFAGAGWVDGSGTVSIDYYDPVTTTSTGNRALWGATDTGSTNRICGYIPSGQTNFQARTSIANTQTFASLASGHNLGGTGRAVMAWTAGTGGITAAENGNTSVGSGSPAGIPASSVLLDGIRIGGFDNGTTNQFAGHIRRFRYYNRRLTNAQVLALSAGLGTIDNSTSVYDSGQIANVTAGFGQSVLVLPQTVQARYLRIDIEDGLNPDGSLNCALLFAGPAFVPGIGLDAASTIGRSAIEASVTSRSGVEYATPQSSARSYSMAFNYLTDSEIWSDIMPLDAVARTGANLLFVPDTSDTAAMSRQAVFGRLRMTADLQYQKAGYEYRTMRATITERN